MPRKMRLWARPLPNPTPAAQKYAEAYENRENPTSSPQEEKTDDAIPPQAEELTPLRPLPPQGDPQSLPRNREGKTTQKRLGNVSVSMSKEEIVFVRGEARRLKTSISALMRTALYFYLDREPPERISFLQPGKPKK